MAVSIPESWKGENLSPSARAVQYVAMTRFNDYSRTNDYWEALATAALEAAESSQ
jgi:hypothetical protein